MIVVQYLHAARALVLCLFATARRQSLSRTLFWCICIADVRFRFVSHTPSSRGANHRRRCSRRLPHIGVQHAWVHNNVWRLRGGLYILKIPDPLAKMNNIICTYIPSVRRRTLSERCKNWLLSIVVFFENRSTPPKLSPPPNHSRWSLGRIFE